MTLISKPTPRSIPTVLVAVAMLALLSVRPAMALPDAVTVTIDVVIVDDLTPKPVPLTDFNITAESAGAIPRIARTDEMGRISLKLDPGNYTFESVRATSFKGRSFNWKKGFAVVAGKDLSLKFTDADASSSKSTGARQISDEAAIYTKYKAGVVTVENDTGHGSGFVVDQSGLILTNQHVTRGSHWLAVRFGHGIRVSAALVLEDAASDTAIIRINPAAVKLMVPLVLADPSAGPLAVEGEKVLAIGSPLHQESVLTTGIVSSVEHDVLISDVNVNHGNSGGPMLNLAGEVIGITTFIDATRQGGPGISGVVAITKALPTLQRARSLPVTDMPDARTLPDVSTTPFPSDALDEAAHDDLKPHLLKAPHNYTTTLITPMIVASLNAAFEREMAKASKHRTGRLPAGSSENTDPISPHRFWERYVDTYQSPVILIQVEPVPRESSASLWAAVFSASVGVRPHTTMEFHSDFYDMQLFRGDRLVEPVRRICVPVQMLYEDLFVTAVDQAHAGVYCYDPSTFEPGAKITLKVRDSSNLKKWETLVLDDSTTGKVWADFESYRAIPGAYSLNEY